MKLLISWNMWKSNILILKNVMFSIRYQTHIPYAREITRQNIIQTDKKKPFLFSFVIIMHKFFTRFENIAKEDERSKKYDESARMVEEKVQLLLSTLQLKKTKFIANNLIDDGIIHPLLYRCLLKTNYFLFAMIILTRNLDKSTYFYVFFYFYVNLLDYPTMS